MGAPFSYTMSASCIWEAPFGSRSGYWALTCVQATCSRLRETAGPSEHLVPSGTGGFVSDLSSTERWHCTRLGNQKPIIDSKDLPFRCTLETQNFRPPGEKELIFTAYGYQGTEVCGIDLATRKVTNYSRAPGQYDEAEGVFPDGKYTCVECDRDNGARKKGSQYIDIWKLALDGSGRTERLTYFNRHPGYKASNPVVSDDGRFMAFQMAKVGDPAGVGRGIFVYDFTKAVRGR